MARFWRPDGGPSAKLGQPTVDKAPVRFTEEAFQIILGVRLRLFSNDERAVIVAPITAQL